MTTKKEILNSEKELQKRKRTYQLTDEAFEKYKQFLSNPNQKKFCFKGYYYIEIIELEDGQLSCAMGRLNNT